MQEIELVHNGLHFRFIRDAALMTAQRWTVIPALPSSPRPSARQRFKHDRQENLIRAPMLGTFSRSPASEQSMFMGVGTRVQAEQTVAVIQTATRIAAVQAGSDGILTHIFPKDGEFVEFDQSLFTIAVT
jgi:acetyl-CoA carboxylase biotin carboxyl carrier protein